MYRQPNGPVCTARTERYRKIARGRRRLADDPRATTTWGQGWRKVFFLSSSFFFSYSSSSLFLPQSTANGRNRPPTIDVGGTARYGWYRSVWKTLLSTTYII
ncbi:hypothetical protein BHM03_00041109 [Ensete ventricosum]|nr:hypothetical protein BHM03_00041109 [Ensete ventricosum]